MPLSSRGDRPLGELAEERIDDRRGFLGIARLEDRPGRPELVLRVEVPLPQGVLEVLPAEGLLIGQHQRHAVPGLGLGHARELGRGLLEVAQAPCARSLACGARAGSAFAPAGAADRGPGPTAPGRWPPGTGGPSPGTAAPPRRARPGRGARPSRIGPGRPASRGPSPPPRRAGPSPRSCSPAARPRARAARRRSPSGSDRAAGGTGDGRRRSGRPGGRLSVPSMTSGRSPPGRRRSPRPERRRRPCLARDPLGDREASTRWVCSRSWLSRVTRPAATSGATMPGP